MAPGDPLACPFCLRAGAVRDFLSLSAPRAAGAGGGAGRAARLRRTRSGRMPPQSTGGAARHGRRAGDPVAGRRADRRDDDGREGRAAHPVLLLRPVERESRSAPSRRSAQRRASPRRSRRRSARGEAGSLLFVTDPAEINRLQRLAVEGNRLGIPVLFGFDVIHGLRTILPVPIALAASWDPGRSSAARRSPRARRGRSASTGPSRRWSTSPATRAGAASIEGAGEDPFLGAAVAAAQVRGFQGRRSARPSA